MANIKKEEVVLTPALAGRLLATNYEGQRKLNTGYAFSLANDIIGGKWCDEIITDPILITDTGKLINGQHRCKAVMIANKPINAEVWYGVPESFFSIVDGGKSRSTAQFINLPHSNILASLGKYICAVRAGSLIAGALHGNTKNPTAKTGNMAVIATRQEVLDCVRENEQTLLECAEMSRRIYRILHGGSKSTFAFALWIIASFHGMEKAKEFVDEIALSIPSSEIIAKGKDNASKQLIEAKTKNVRINSLYWVSLVLAMFEGWHYGSDVLTKRKMDAAIEKYNKLLKATMEV